MRFICDDCNLGHEVEEYREKLEDIMVRRKYRLLDDEVKKYSGIRWIGQPSCAIRNNSEREFLDFEKNLTESLCNVNASLLCIYDAYDYMHERKFISETVIKESLYTHSYIFKDLVLEAIN